MEIDPVVVQIFKEEAAERLDRIVDLLLSIEAGQAVPDVINLLFRDAHSIKGNAAMVGYGEVRAIAHAMEDVLDRARVEGKLAPEAVEPLLRAADAIRRGVAGEHGIADEVVPGLTTKAAEAPRSPAPPPAPQQRIPAGNGASGGAPGGSAVSGGQKRSMRVATEKVDRLLDVVGETVLHHRRLEHLLERDERAGERDEEVSRGEILLSELQDSVIRMRTLPLSSITGSFPRAVRDLAVEQGKEVELTISGAETQLDRVILDGISETITHLLRNAVSHGIEPPAERDAAGKPRRGRIHLQAEQRGGMVAIEVADDGRGVSPEILERAREVGSLTDVLAAPGFSTAAEVTHISGRGVGLDAVKSHVESLGGSLEVASEPGAGTRFVVLLPLTLALLHVLLVERGGHPYAIPMGSVEEAIAVTDRLSLTGRASLELRGSTVPLADLAELLGAAAPDLAQAPPAVVVRSSQNRAAAICDRLLGDQEVVIKSLGLLAGVGGYLGAAILGDGRIALVLDPAFLARARARGRTAVVAPAAEQRIPKVLVVDDQFTVRELQRSILEAAGYQVATARDGREALELVRRDSEVELVVTDIQMPAMDGFGLLEAIRSDGERASLPVVIVTSLGNEEHRRRGAELGADAYIVKEDFDQQALLETVRRLVGR